MDALGRLRMELGSLKATIGLSSIQQFLTKDFSSLLDNPEALKQLQAVAMFARRAAEALAEIQAGEQPTTEAVEGQGGHTLGAHAQVSFPMFNKAIEGKIDTGATSSSLHATNIQAKGGRVSFQCELLSPNIITLPTEGTQEVHSADFGGDKRPVVRMDIEIDGVPLKGVMLNLNDRSDMDSKLLVGQDVLKAGNFVVDVTQGEQQGGAERDQQSSMTAERPMRESVDEAKLYEAIHILADSDITLKEFVEYLQTEAVNRIKG